MRLLVCGGRDFGDDRMLRKALCQIQCEGHVITHLLHGAARGADTMADLWANEQHSIIVMAFRAEWDLYGRGAGPKRNQRMLDEGVPDEVLAFWDGKSRGTLDMITRATRAGVQVRIRPY